MGLLTVTQFQNLTDLMYQRIAAVVAGAPNMLVGNTAEGLATYLDGATGDPDLQTALLSACAGVDRLALSANQGAFLARIVAEPKWQALAKAIQSYVTTDAGGGYASLGAYVDALGATVHPLVAEVFRVLGDNALGGGVMHPKMDLVSFDRVYTGVQGSLVDDTTDAGSTTTADVALFAADNTVIVLGSKHRTSGVLLDLSTLASVDVGLLGYYWNGSAWAALTLTDHTGGLSVNGGLIEYTLPDDAVPHNRDMQGTPAYFDATQTGELYYVILQRTTDTVVTPPVATWIKTVPEAIAITPGGTSLFGVDQPPIALIRITAANVAVVTVIQQPDYARFAAPGTANNALKLVAVTHLADNVTVTLGYTDQDGNAGSKAQTAWTQPIAAGAVENVTLANGDTAIRSLVAANCSISTTATHGVLALVVDDYPRAIAAK